MTDRHEVSLGGRTAIVTGGGRGIGRAVAEALAGRGASLVLLGRSEEPLAETAESLSSRSDVPVRYRTLDVTDADGVDRVFAEFVADTAPDILVNNAGGTGSAPFTRLTHEAWDETLTLNLSSVFACTRAVLPAMLDAGYGRIVNVASTAGLTGYRYVAAYCAAKHGVVGLTRALAREVAEKGITVNAVCPGFTDTDMLRDSIRTIAEKTGRSADAARAELAASNPQGRLVEPGEVAATVAWLCSDTAAAINGQAIAVDGGEVA